MQLLYQSRDTSMSNDLFHEAELVANDTAKQVIDYQKDPQLNVLDKYKDFIWFALPKNIVEMEGYVTDNKTLFRSLACHDNN
ncbi:unnamed protein product [Rotaria sp. Silwood2]|nr:unnamed protein product [Rotaria sp. Silwood2]